MVFFASPAMPEVIGDELIVRFCIFSRIQIIFNSNSSIGVWTVELTSFIGRKRELGHSDSGRNGRRESSVAHSIRPSPDRETRLFDHWDRDIWRRVLYWVANPTSSLDQLRSFSQAL